MNTDFPDSAPTTDVAIFSSLRAKLAREVSGSAMLAALLEKVNRMQECHDCPEDFKVRFDEFVVRAEEYLHLVRPFFPALVQFLRSQRGDRPSVERSSFEAPGEPDLTGEVA
jgi:ATP-dependent RNA circularization protein (DNA/RNA ligase family)